MTKPFKNNPVKQERFEQFLKDKFEGGLRSTFSAGAAGLSEADRARERLDFEAALDAMQKGELYMEQDNSSNQQLPQVITISTDLQFITSGAGLNKQTQIEEKLPSKIYPKRQEFEWRPAPVLCKRFDIMDPFMGKPPPAPRARSRMDALVFAPEFITNMNESTSLPLPPSSDSRQPQISMKPDTETETETADRSVQKPVDLYKAIFSSDSDEDEGPAIDDKVETTKKAEGANTALNRLVAEDFLDSLGKELGLEIPSSSTYVSNKESDTTKAPMEVQQNSLAKGKAVVTAKSGDVGIGERGVTSGCSSLFSSGEGIGNQVGKLNSIEEHTDRIYIGHGTSNLKCSGVSTDCSSQYGTDGAVETQKEGSRTADSGTHPNRPHGSGDRASDSSYGCRFQEKKNSRTTNDENEAIRHRGHTRHDDSSSSDSDSYHLQKSDGRIRKGEKKESHHGRHREHSRRYKNRSDTESSSDDGCRHGLDSKYHRKAYHEKSKTHSKRHRDRRKKHHSCHHSDDGKHRRK